MEIKREKPIARGVSNLMYVGDVTLPEMSPNERLLYLASSLACAYHGYKRNDSVGWAIAWGALGGLSLITPVIALAQGYGKPKVVR